MKPLKVLKRLVCNERKALPTEQHPTLDVMQYHIETRNCFYKYLQFKRVQNSFLLIFTACADNDYYYCGHGNVNRNKSHSKLLSLTLTLQ